MSKSDSILADLYPDLEKRRERARAQRKRKAGSSVDALRGSMSEMFGDLDEDMRAIQSPHPVSKPSAPAERPQQADTPVQSETPSVATPAPTTAREGIHTPVSHTVSQHETDTSETVSRSPSQCETNCETEGQTPSETTRHTPGETDSETPGQTQRVTHGETLHETVPPRETASETVPHYATVSQRETPCETVAAIHPHKLRFLAYVLAVRKPGEPWRFTVRDAADAMGMKYITVRNYPKFCANYGWLKYRTVKSAAWQGIEVEWMDRRVEETLLKNPVSPRETPRETSSHTHAASQRETGYETVPPRETVAPPLDRKKESLSISSEEFSEGAEASCPIKRKLLAFSDEDVAFFYPNLAKIGFGNAQIRQILEKLAMVDKPYDKLCEAMEHADFELEKGQLVAAGGKPVDQPLGYVFRALATTGYYRRPDGYVSATEQAERDAAEEFQRLSEARKQREEAEFDAWLAQLAPEERAALLEGKMGPERQWLKQKWRELR